MQPITATLAKIVLEYADRPDEDGRQDGAGLLGGAGAAIKENAAQPFRGAALQTVPCSTTELPGRLALRTGFEPATMGLLWISCPFIAARPS